MFVDEVDIDVAAGHGGRGAMSFRREKFVPRGGPDGGNGGDGGSVYLTASSHFNTLVKYRFHPEHEAERGRGGSGANRTGANGPDLELDVPIGTLVYGRLVGPDPEESGDAEATDDELPAPRKRGRRRSKPEFEPTVDGDGEWHLIADLAEEGQRVLVARGGKGGLGNAFFATSTNRAPRKSQPGEPGENPQAPPAPEAAGRCRPGGLSQRRQVHAHLAHLRGAAQDRELPVHDTHAEPRRGDDER